MGRHLYPFFVQFSKNIFVLLTDDLDGSGGLNEDVVIVLFEKVGEIARIGLWVFDQFIGDGGGAVDEGEGIVDEAHGLAVGHSVALMHRQHSLHNVYDVSSGQLSQDGLDVVDASE